MEQIYQRLEVWKRAVDFSINIIQCISEILDDEEHRRITEEIEISAVNIATNIAKGKACLSRDDFIYHLCLSRRSLYEALTLLEILKRKELISDKRYTDIEAKGQKITGLLIQLIRSIKEAANGRASNGLRVVQKH